MKIDYYFSVLSPFSYLGAERFLKLVTKYDLDVQEKPFDLIGEIFPNTGGCQFLKDTQLDKNIDYWSWIELRINMD